VTASTTHYITVKVNARAESGTVTDLAVRETSAMIVNARIHISSSSSLVRRKGI
jgi:hypothetical protein